MKKLLLAIAFLLVPLTTAPFIEAQTNDVSSYGVELLQVGGDVYVKGYYRRNGTYVRPHYRSAPDGNPYNNYSFPENTNPYTGKVAPGNPNTYLENYYNRGSGYNRGSNSFPSCNNNPGLNQGLGGSGNFGYGNPYNR